jgi:hypothetical protein
MKSLDQVEARTPLEAGQPGISVVNGNYLITASGSYYLTRNLVFTNSNNNGIDFANQDVTLDLNGFSLSATSTSGSKSIINFNGSAGQKVTIRNGHITGSGTNASGCYYGISTSSSTTGSALVEDVHLYNVVYGINLNDSVGRNIVRNCSVEKAGYNAIRSDVVTGCTVVNAGNVAIVANSVSDCQVSSDASVPSTAQGIHSLSIPNACVVQNCSVVARGPGIIARTVINSYASSVNDTAILADVVNNCTASRPNGTAIDATVANGCYALAGTNIINFKYNMP